MLIEFSVANYRSLRDKQTFTLARGNGDEMAATNSFTAKAANEFELLRSAAIYGPNASGKSNFLKAIEAMKDIVVNSATNLKRGDKLPVAPYRLSRATQSAPCEFEVIFLVEGVRYQYGFTSTEKRIDEEWLFAYPKGRAQRWFARAWNDDTGQHEWDLGNNLTGEKQLWQRSTRDNALFLSSAVQLNSKQLQPIYDWFRSTLRMTNVQGWNAGFTISLCHKDDKSKVLDFLRAADLDIDDILLETKPLDPKALPEDMPEYVKSALLSELKGRELVDIRTVHKTTEGDSVVFDLEDESDGTQKLFAFAGPWLDSLKNGYVLFIDELHDNLHPKLVQFLVQLFHSDKTNPKNAQLVFTTHETSILNQEVFRRDQIWFCEKDDQQASHLYPLTDFNPRKGRENLELAYFSGRYGALPYIRPLDVQG